MDLNSVMNKLIGPNDALEVVLEREDGRLAPGDTLRGAVAWRSGKTPKALIVQLGWRTVGRGTRDSRTVAEIKIPQGPTWAEEGAETFALDLPADAGPWSYRGRLLAIQWQLKVQLDVAWQIDPRKEIELTVAPDGQAREPMREPG